MPRPTPETDFFPRYEQAGMVRDGHFRLASGRHATEKVDFDRLYDDPELTVDVGNAMGGLILDTVGLTPIYLVGVDSGGNRLLEPVADGYEKLTGIRPAVVLTARTVPPLPHRFYIEPGSWPSMPAKDTGHRGVIVEDVVNRYTNSGEVAELLIGHGYEVDLIIAGLRRGTQAVSPQGVRSRAVVERQMLDWRQEDCAPCEEGAPLTN
jgi:orotate phosphoribosyltransferase